MRLIQFLTISLFVFIAPGMAEQPQADQGALESEANDCSEVELLSRYCEPLSSQVLRDILTDEETARYARHCSLLDCAGRYLLTCKAPDHPELCPSIHFIS